MLTKTAQADLKSLRQQGFVPTDEEVVELNEIAVRIERGKDVTPANMPRVGFAGNVVLHEPTVGALEWWYDYGRDAAWTTNGRMMTYFFMLANSRRLENLLSLERPRDIRSAVRSWKKTVDATESELWRALMWVKYGGEMPDVETGDGQVESTVEEEETFKRLWMTVISASGALGLTPDQLKTQTQSELVSMLVQSNLHARIPMKASVARDYIAYRQLLKRIEARCGVQKEDGDGQ